MHRCVCVCELYTRLYIFSQNISCVLLLSFFLHLFLPLSIHFFFIYIFLSSSKLCDHTFYSMIELIHEFQLYDRKHAYISYLHSILSEKMYIDVHTFSPRDHYVSFFCFVFHLFFFLCVLLLSNLITLTYLEMRTYVLFSLCFYQLINLIRAESINTLYTLSS